MGKIFKLDYVIHPHRWAKGKRHLLWSHSVKHSQPLRHDPY